LHAASVSFFLFLDNFQNEIEKKKNEAKRRLVEYRGDAKYRLDSQPIFPY